MRHRNLIERLHVEDGDGNVIFKEVLDTLLPNDGPTTIKLLMLWEAGGRIDAALDLYKRMLPEWRGYGITFDGHWGRCEAYVEEDVESARWSAYYEGSMGRMERARRQANHPSFAIVMAMLRALSHPT